MNRIPYNTKIPTKSEFQTIKYQHRVSTQRFVTTRLSSPTWAVTNFQSSSSTAPFKTSHGWNNSSDWCREVNWLVRCWNKFILLVSVDLRASQIFREEKGSCPLYMGAHGSEEILASILQMIFSKQIFFEWKQVSRVNNLQRVGQPSTYQ